MSHCNPASTVSINLSNVAGAPFSPNDMTRNSDLVAKAVLCLSLPLNAVTINDAYPLPRIDDSFDHLSGSCWFSTLDLYSRYWQVECEGSDRHKTVFATRSGLYECRVMPSVTFVGTGHDSTIFVFSGSVAIPASDITCPK
jgi:hypothetical protein